MSDLQTRMRAAFNASTALHKAAGDEAIIENADQTPEVTAVASPADGQTGAASDIIATQTSAEDGKLGSITPPDVDMSNVGEGGIDAAQVEPTKEGEAAAILNVKQEPVTKEEIDMIDKAASAIMAAAARINGYTAEQLAEGFSKKASEVTVDELLQKRADAGDPAAQYALDYLASFELGMKKKANDLEQMGAQTPEEIEMAEAALNEAATENPDAVVADVMGGEGEEVEGEGEGEEAGDEELAEELANLSDEEIEALLQEDGAEVEGALQETIADVAELLLEEDPELDEETAVLAAQDIVSDAAQTIEAQDAIGAMDENGEYLVGDEDAAGAVEEMVKTASAYPLRDAVVACLSDRIGFSPDAFAHRLFN